MANTKNILLRLPPELAAALDAEVSDLHQKRNTYIVNALTELLEHRLGTDQAPADAVPLFDVNGLEVGSE